MEISRRAVIGGAAALGLGSMMGAVTACGPTSTKGALLTRIGAENRRPGSKDWRPNAKGLHPSQDGLGQIQGYASTSSVSAGDHIAFHVSTGKKPAEFTVTIHRLGHYGGLGGRLMTTSPRLRGVPQSKPVVDPATGTVRCSWHPSWTTPIPQDWPSGLYLASFTTETGHRSAAPFVVREDARNSEFLVVLPFGTYQAYNQFPMDGHLGRNLYYGYVKSTKDPAVHAISPDGLAYPAQPVRGHTYALHYPERARTVSFDRPYSHDGIPRHFELDRDFITWAESKGHDLTYTTSLDLHEGRVDPAKHTTIVISGHDEYWSGQMRDAVEKSVRGGTNLALFAANSIYWKVRINSSAGTFPTVTCYKDDPDPHRDPTGSTTTWRSCQPNRAASEQKVLGSQYTGILAAPVPLVVSDAQHWFWSGTGLKNGDRIPNLISGEADGVMRGTPRPDATEHALLSASPFVYPNHGQRTQNTSLYKAHSGAWVFNAGTFGWTPALAGTAAQRNHHIQKATTNLFNKLRA